MLASTFGFAPLPPFLPAITLGDVLVKTQAKRSFQQGFGL